MGRPVHAVPRMAALVQALIKDVLDAYITGDAAKADAVRDRDEEVDELYTSLFRELLTYMMEDPRRSEERTVGKECVRTCRSRGSPDHKNKKTHQYYDK